LPKSPEIAKDCQSLKGILSRWYKRACLGLCFQFRAMFGNFGTAGNIEFVRFAGRQ
jgi:hypothetical protein